MQENIFKRRRDGLLQSCSGKTFILHSGIPTARNITAASYPFRVNSHVLYYFGVLPAEALCIFNQNSHFVFLDEPSLEAKVWDGLGENFDVLAERSGVDRILPRSELSQFLSQYPAETFSVLPSLHSLVNSELERVLGRTPDLYGQDRDFAKAVVEQRMIHDHAAMDELRAAANLTSEAHLHTMRMVRSGLMEYEVRAEIESYSVKRGATHSFPSIVTVQGEVLHQMSDRNQLADGDMLLVDYGAETPQGYAGDVTRSYPVNGKFSAEQKAIYGIVLEAQLAAIAHVAPGIEYSSVHLQACRKIIEGFIDLKVFSGSPDGLLEQKAHMLVFPHGVGHLVGLDVHDMEDLGSITGFPEGREPNGEYGLHVLRLDRPLQKNMLVTVEPGIYFIPAILDDPDRKSGFKGMVDFNKLNSFRSIGGIRIEDEVLVTDSGFEVITDAPKTVKQLEDIRRS